MTLSAVFWRCAGRILYAERDSYLAPGIVVAAEALVRHEIRSQAKATVES